MARGRVAGVRLSARAHDRILKVARTLADLAGCDTIDVPDIGVAVAYRQLDRAAGRQRGGFAFEHRGAPGEARNEPAKRSSSSGVQ